MTTNVVPPTEFSFFEPMRTFLALLLLIVYYPAQAQNREMGLTELALQKFIQDAAFKHGEVAFMAVNLDNGRVIAEYNNFKSMVPASIQKLVTTATALEKLGPDFRFKTRIAYDGVIEAGVLKGNLYVFGGGDPTLQSRYNKTEPGALSRVTTILAPIQKAEGRLIVDLSHYNRYTTPRGWVWEDIGNYFGSTPTALMWRDNLLEVALRTGQAGTPAMLADAQGEASPFTIDVQVTAANSQKDDAWFFSSPGSDVIYAKGTIPAHQQRFVVKASHPDPVRQFTTDVLNASGKKMEVRFDYDYIPHEGLTELMTIESPSLKDLVRLTNDHSINLYAEALNITLDTLERYKTVEGGIAHTEAFLKSRKVYLQGTRLTDGSGLSPLNRMTCQAMIDVLSMMYRSANRDVFYNSLAVAGLSGTLSGHFKGTRAENNLRGKSGTMAGVRNYAGYITNKSQEKIAFCLMINDYDEKKKAEVMKKVEELLVSLIDD